MPDVSQTPTIRCDFGFCCIGVYTGVPEAKFREVEVGLNTKAAEAMKDPFAKLVDSSRPKKNESEQTKKLRSLDSNMLSYSAVGDMLANDFEESFVR